MSLAAQSHEASSPGPSDGGRSKSLGTSILLVEDEMFIRLAMADALRAAGFEVNEAADADEALRIYEANGAAMVITDIMMPGSIDGLSLAKLIRDRQPSAKIVLVSANKYSDMASVADAVFFKPVSIAHMLDSVRALMDVSGGETPLG